jgi:hypothetical protein
MPIWHFLPGLRPQLPRAGAVFFWHPTGQRGIPVEWALKVGPSAQARRPDFASMAHAHRRPTTAEDHPRRDARLWCSRSPRIVAEVRVFQRRPSQGIMIVTISEKAAEAQNSVRRGVVGQFDCGRITGLNRATTGAYSRDVRAATNFRGAEESRVWLGGRYSVARWRNGSNQGLYYGT